MRSFIIVCVAMISVAATARTPMPNPLLGKVIGGVGEDGTAEAGDSYRCYIYPNQVLVQKFDAETGKTQSGSKAVNLNAAYVAQVQKKLHQAASQKENIALHIVETRPHKFYFGFLSSPRGEQRVRLFYDGSRAVIREGNEAGELLRVIEHLCPKLK